jgi:type II secretory ATPase GspE/PulE/Tfp pilus assembly ATPase PilB-like protein
MIEDSNVPLDKILNTILENAVDSGVHEVHIQRQMLDTPVQDEIRGLPTLLSFTRNEGVFVFFRGADGLEKQLDLPHFVMKPLCGRIQELSDTKASEQHGFPEGRLHFEYGSQRYDWQVLVGPNELGEKVVLKQTPS